MTKALTLIGKRFGKLLVVAREANNKHGGSMWKAVCSCGAITVCHGPKLKAGKTKSCGCLITESVVARCTTHGQASRAKRTRAYTAWKEMNRRVKRDPSYTSRGITVCARWVASYENFYADMGDCPEHYELDRIDNSKGYEPSNVRWASETTQARNRTYCKVTTAIADKIRESTKPTKELMSEYGLSKSTINKIKRGASWA